MRPQDRETLHALARLNLEGCARCPAKGVPLIMSRFNTDMLCAACKTKEQAHPRYQEAVDAELAACKRGDFNFPGIGKPDDL